jgi:hypothetical protein
LTSMPSAPYDACDFRRAVTVVAEPFSKCLTAKAPLCFSQ